MEMCDMSQPRPKKGKKSKVDSCPSFKTKASKKVKIDWPEPDKKPPIPVIEKQGAHMNMRDIGNDPGVVKPSFEMTADGQKRSSYKDGDKTAAMAELKMTRRKKKK
jgi:hypothetical protein